MIPQDVKQTTQQKLENAKTKLMLENPYFGSLVTSIEPEIEGEFPFGEVLELVSASRNGYRGSPHNPL